MVMSVNETPTLDNFVFREIQNAKAFLDNSNVNIIFYPIFFDFYTEVLKKLAFYNVSITIYNNSSDLLSINITLRESQNYAAVMVATCLVDKIKIDAPQSNCYTLSGRMADYSDVIGMICERGKIDFSTNLIKNKAVTMDTEISLLKEHFRKLKTALQNIF